LPNDENHTQDARLSLEPYLYEAGLDPDNLYGNRKLVLEGLMVYHVIDKRHLELNELAQGEKGFLVLEWHHWYRLTHN